MMDTLKRFFSKQTWESTKTTFILLGLLIVFGHILYIWEYGWLTNSFLEYYFYVIGAMALLCFISIFMVKDRGFKIAFGVFTATLILFLGAYYLIFIYIVALAGAFSHG